jgi:hypothetical protein
LNQEPLLPAETSARAVESQRDELSNPERESIVLIDETDDIQVFVKVPEEKLWVIQDPLSVSDSLLIRPICTDLILNWSLEIGESSAERIDVNIPLNILDPVHEKILELLASGSVVGLHFVHANSLLALGQKCMRSLLGKSYISHLAAQAKSILQALPRESDAREAALRDFAMSKELGMMAWAERMGICMEPLYLLQQNRLGQLGDIDVLNLKMREHVRSCERCRSIWDQKNFG